MKSIKTCEVVLKMTFSVRLSGGHAKDRQSIDTKNVWLMSMAEKHKMVQWHTTYASNFIRINTDSTHIHMAFLKSQRNVNPGLGCWMRCIHRKGSSEPDIWSRKNSNLSLSNQNIWSRSNAKFETNHHQRPFRDLKGFKFIFCCDICVWKAKSQINDTDF